MKSLKSVLTISLLFAACSTGGPGDPPVPGSGGNSPPASGGSGGTPTGSGGASGSGGAPGGDGGQSGSGGSAPTTGGSGGTPSPGVDGGSPPATDGAPPAGGTGGSGPAPAGGIAVLTSRYDNARTGANTSETILTTKNVNKDSFGLLFTKPLKGLVYGQPLYVPGLSFNGTKHNVIYVATEQNVVYAYDADDGAAPALWSKTFEAPLPLTNGFPKCADMKASGVAGVTATPVIDLEQNKLFVVTKSTDAHRLHALDLITGEDGPAPVTVSAGPGFDSRISLNRPGLLLQDGTIYIGFGSHCDEDHSYHGWVLAYDAKTLQAKGVYNTTPNGDQGAIWQSGIGLAGDGKGGILFCVGNGTIGGMNTSENVVRLKQSGTQLMLDARYAPPNAAALNGADNDLTAGVVLVPGSDLIISGGKEGPIYLLDQAMAIKQTVRPPAAKDRDGLHSLNAWNGSAGPMVYAWPSGGQLYAYGLAGGQLALKSMGGITSGHPGGTVIVSSNGNMPDTGVAWATVPRVGDSWHGTATGSLYAFDATDVSKQLWSSDDNPADALKVYAKFSPPLVVNGKVYVATFSPDLKVYGLKAK
jgi:hypothetical protein